MYQEFKTELPLNHRGITKLDGQKSGKQRELNWPLSSNPCWILFRSQFFHIICQNLLLFSRTMHCKTILTTSRLKVI